MAEPHGSHETVEEAPGKARDPRFNALRHGLTARAILLREEEAEQFQSLRDDFFRQWCPAGETECSQVHEMAESQWLLLRCTPMESELLESLRDPDAPIGGLAAAFLGGRKGDGGDLLRIRRYRRSIERSFDRALHNLLLLHRVRGVWSRPNLVEPEEGEAFEFTVPVKERWLSPVTQAQPRPRRDDEDHEFGNATVTVERVIIGPDGERIPWEEYLAREQAAQETQAPAQPEGENPAPKNASQAAVRPKADILRNGPDFEDEIPEEPDLLELTGRVPRDRRRS